MDLHPFAHSKPPVLTLISSDRFCSSRHATGGAGAEGAAMPQRMLMDIQSWMWIGMGKHQDTQKKDCLSAWLSGSVCVCVSVCMYACMHVPKSVSKYVYACMHACMTSSSIHVTYYIYIYMCVHMHNQYIICMWVKRDPKPGVFIGLHGHFVHLAASRDITSETWALMSRTILFT